MWPDAQSRDKQMAFEGRKQEQETRRYHILADLVKKNTQSDARTWGDEK